jgi:hypothetical protein
MGRIWAHRVVIGERAKGWARTIFLQAQAKSVDSNIVWISSAKNKTFSMNYKVVK